MWKELGTVCFATYLSLDERSLTRTSEMRIKRASSEAIREGSSNRSGRDEAAVATLCDCVSKYA